MNIAVSLYGGKGFCIRPDSTLEREGGEYYVPAEVTELTFVPVVFVRVNRAGKSIQAKFAERYYDSAGFGALIYGESLIGAFESGFAMASSLDRTSVLPGPLYDLSVIRNKDNVFGISNTGKCYSTADTDVNEAIAAISSLTSLKTGDFVAIEMDRRINIQAGETIRGTLNDTEIFSIEIR